MAQRRLIPPLVFVTVFGLISCGSDDIVSEQSDQTAPARDATTSSTTPSTDESTQVGATTMPSDDAHRSEPTISLELNPDVTRPVSSVVDQGDQPVPVPAEPAGDDVGRAIAHVRLLVGNPDADVELIVAEEVTWPDGALGCPQPGMVYTQALVNGSRVVVRHDGIDYSYHRGGGRDLFWCPTATFH